MLENIKIGPRLAIAFAGVLLMLVIVAVSGYIGIGKVHAGLKTVYEDRTVSLGQLADIDHLLQRSRILMADAIDAQTPAEMQRHFDELNEGLQRSEKLWNDYIATQLTSEEKQLADTPRCAAMPSPCARPAW